MTDSRRGGGLIFCGHRRVGKTVAAAGVTCLLQKAGKRVAVFKPVALEADRSRIGRISHDAELLAGCAKSAEPLHQINPIALRGSVPIGFAADGSADVGPQDLIGIAAGMQRDHDVLVVEGLDGLMCRYAPQFTELDLIRILDLVMVWVMPPMLSDALLTPSPSRRPNPCRSPIAFTICNKALAFPHVSSMPSVSLLVMNPFSKHSMAKDITPPVDSESMPYLLHRS